MKDIKTFVIGFLTCACMFLIMGHTDEKSEDEKSEMELLREGLLNDDIETDKNMLKDIKTFLTENGRYQLSTTTAISKKGSVYVVETVIDTKTGIIVRRKKISLSKNKRIHYTVFIFVFFF